MVEEDRGVEREPVCQLGPIAGFDSAHNLVLETGIAKDADEKRNPVRPRQDGAVDSDVCVAPRWRSFGLGNRCPENVSIA